MIEIKKAYQKIFSNDLAAMLEKLAKHYNKNTMLHMFKHLVNTDQRQRNDMMQSKEKVNMMEINKNVEWMMATKGFKHAEKEKMAQLLCINSNDYIRILCKQYKMKHKNNEDVGDFITTKYGAKSTAGTHLKQRVNFVDNSDKYFAEKIKEMGDSKGKFKEHSLELVNVFLSRFQTDLNQIRLQFNKDNDKDLHHFIKDYGDSTSYFLIKICDNCKRLK